jgi:hypothetical protein
MLYKIHARYWWATAFIARLITILASSFPRPKKKEKKEPDQPLKGPCSQQGASWVVCGSGVPPYDFLNVYGIFNIMFSIRNG